MTKQDEIREGTVKILTTQPRGTIGITDPTWVWEREDGARAKVEHIFTYLHSQGVVIKVDTAEPPIFFNKSITTDSKQLAQIVERIRLTYKKAGYVAVEPLIKE